MKTTVNSKALSLTAGLGLQAVNQVLMRHQARLQTKVKTDSR